MSAKPNLFGLFVGGNEYGSSAIRNLSFAVADVVAVEEWFARAAGLNANRSILLANPRRSEFLEALARFGEAPMTGDDTFLFYFAGHGFALGEETYLLTADSSPLTRLTLEDTAVSFARLRHYLRPLRAGQQILILDHCRNEPSGLARGAAEAGVSAAMARDLGALARSGPDEPGRPGVRRAILSACWQGQVSYEYPQGSHSWFCHNLLPCLNERRGSPIEIGELAEQLGVRMRETAWRQFPAAKDQSPHLILEGGRIFLAGDTADEEDKRRRDERAREENRARVEAQRKEEAARLHAEAEARRQRTEEARLRAGAARAEEEERRRREDEARPQPAAKPARRPVRSVAKRWLIKACLFAVPVLVVVIACIDNWPEYRIKAAFGDTHAMELLGYEYEVGRGGVAVDETKSVYWRQKAAEGGNLAAMRSLAYVYQQGCCGLSTSDSQKQAADWYRKLAERGDVEAVSNLARMYDHGCCGLSMSDSKMQAATWYRKAADGGDSYSMCYLGIMYERGQGGLPKDDAQALIWCRKAADAGDGFAKYLIGQAYDRERFQRFGLPKDDAQAVNWYRSAAEAGDGYGMHGLGSMYETGRGGLQKDVNQAVYWYQKAVDKGGDPANKARLELKRLGRAVKDR